MQRFQIGAFRQAGVQRVVGAGAGGVEDAGGAIPEEFANYHDKPGCTPFEDRSKAHGALFKKD